MGQASSSHKLRGRYGTGGLAQNLREKVRFTWMWDQKHGGGKAIQIILHKRLMMKYSTGDSERQAPQSAS